jgi:hypothetical protein
MSPDDVLDVALRDGDDRPVTLRSLLPGGSDPSSAGGALVVVFVRHFG